MNRRPVGEPTGSLCPRACVAAKAADMRWRAGRSAPPRSRTRRLGLAQLMRAAKRDACTTNPTGCPGAGIRASGSCLWGQSAGSPWTCGRPTAGMVFRAFRALSSEGTGSNVVGASATEARATAPAPWAAGRRPSPRAAHAANITIKEAIVQERTGFRTTANTSPASRRKSRRLGSACRCSEDIGGPRVRVRSAWGRLPRRAPPLTVSGKLSPGPKARKRKHLRLAALPLVCGLALLPAALRG
jgi:hypothetical protein